MIIKNRSKRKSLLKKKKTKDRILLLVIMKIIDKIRKINHYRQDLVFIIVRRNLEIVVLAQLGQIMKSKES